MSEVSLTMAKADQDDIDKVVKFFQLIDEWMEHGTHTIIGEGDEDDQETELSLEQFVDKLREMWGGRWKPAGVDCAWSRVVFGHQTLVSNCCDPNNDVLAWKPEIAALLQQAEGAGK